MGMAPKLCPVQVYNLRPASRQGFRAESNELRCPCELLLDAAVLPLDDDSGTVTSEEKRDAP